MFNNRMLAVAAVLVMAVPALGAATPIVVPPVPEQLVEGHTVFTVIEIVRYTSTAETRFAAAVAVLVREYQNEARAQRFPGVLWFNDQYLVNPRQSASDSEFFRYPCGGAVLAVNAGDPDPRIAMVRVDTDGTPDGQTSVGTTNHTYPVDEYWVKPYADKNGDGFVDSQDQDGNGRSDDEEYYYGEDSGGPGDAPTDYAWVGVKGPGSGDAQVYSDTVIGSTAGGADQNGFGLLSPWDYQESYLITDPNDHSWVVDKYNFYTRDAIRPDGTTTTGVIYDYPVWAVNILGSPVFIPDGGNSLENCMPFRDLLEDAYTATGLQQATCGLAVEDGNILGTGNDTDLKLAPGSPVAPWTDDPCMSYSEPSRNSNAAAPDGFCYGGQPATDSNGDGTVDKDDCLQDRANGNQFSAKPLRLYNALLYFKLQDLTIAGTTKDHSDPTTNPDTNGCSEEQYWWGPNPPLAASQYPCPDDDDDREGNSHSFHPTTPVHQEAEPCLPQFAGPNPTNHGGSGGITPATPVKSNGYYEGTPCDYEHATRNIDIFFSPGGRPFEPVLRFFDVMDLEGSSAPFQDYHMAYGTP